jgi:hypothetical protein
VGPGFDYFYLPAEETCGEILLAWRSSVWSVTITSIQVFSISAQFKTVVGGPVWWMMTVYGPCSDGGKLAFLTKLQGFAPYTFWTLVTLWKLQHGVPSRRQEQWPNHSPSPTQRTLGEKEWT